MLALSSLNPPQREAVLHRGGPLVVFAGAGSGKTRVITHRVAHLVAEHDVPPWRILAVTFTNRAAGEMRERLRVLLGPAASDLWVGTFHATCARLLRRYAAEAGVRPDFTIYDDADQQAMLRRILRDLDLDDRRWPPKKVAARINRAKQEVIGPDELPVDDFFDEQVRRVYAAYEGRMTQIGALDFGDLIYRLVVALERDPPLREALVGRFSEVLVDEFQDTNRAQFRLLSALCGVRRQLCVVGDDDQSIYRWRGADRRNILDFKETFPDARIVKLEQNYRSTGRILRVANAVITRNVDREPKELWTENEEGPEVLVVRCHDERDEAQMVVRAVRELGLEGRPLSDVVVFYRIHAQSRVLEEALRAANVRYRVVGGTRFYDRAEVKDVLAYLRVLHNADDDVSLLRIVNTPSRGIGKTTLERLLDSAARSGVGVWAVLADPARQEGVGLAARRKIAAFVSLMQELRARAAGGVPLAELAQAVVERSGYVQALRDEDTPEADARLQNLEELIGSMAEHEEGRSPEENGLASFLETVTLQTSADEVDEGDKLTLMTVHAAKGLEFPVVLVTGLEERMFPFRGGDPWESPEELEEERRLAYVAFTRACERLVLSWAQVRRIFGQVRPTEPSRFLAELPPDDLKWLGGPSPWTRRPSEPAAAAPEARPAETYLDPSEGSDLDGLVLGMRVRHPKFGVGRVRALGPGIPPRVTVHFPRWGDKKLVASYLEPA